MAVLRTILTVIFVIICIALTVLVLMQEGKSQGLGKLSAVWQIPTGERIKARSMEGALVKITTGLAVGFMVLVVVLNPELLNLGCEALLQYCEGAFLPYRDRRP